MYVVDYNSEEPIMLLNRQIGKTTLENGEWDGTPYIDGSTFQEELMYLDSMGKKRIQVWINSPGGSIMEAMSIFSAIMKSNTPVDTYNVGVAASAAGAVFMAGRKRIMADYAQFMMHPVGGSDDDQAMAAFKNSCVTMLHSKSNMTDAIVSMLMDVTSWIGASDCLMKGICTEIEVTKDGNKKYMPSGDVKAMLTYSNNILNSLLNHKNPQTMVKITNKLNLTEGSSEEVILSAINKLEEARNSAEAAATQAQTDLDAAKAQAADLQSQLDAANARIAEAEAAEAAALAASNELAATDMVNSFVNKIGNKPETLAKWVNLAKADLEGTKAMLEELPLNKVAPGKVPAGNPAAKPVSAAGAMHHIAKANNQL